MRYDYGLFLCTNHGACDIHKVNTDYNIFLYTYTHKKKPPDWEAFFIFNFFTISG